ncbi:Fc.00g060490.m01.CDS01 [Cosmosporella sp. VM-42]
MSTAAVAPQARSTIIYVSNNRARPLVTINGVGNLFHGLDLSGAVCTSSNPGLRVYSVRHDQDTTLPAHKLEWSVCRCGGIIVITSDEHTRSIPTGDPRHLHFVVKTDGQPQNYRGTRLQVAQNLMALRQGDARFARLARRFGVFEHPRADGSGGKTWVLVKRRRRRNAANRCEVCSNQAGLETLIQGMQI